MHINDNNWVNAMAYLTAKAVESNFYLYSIGLDAVAYTPD